MALNITIAPKKEQPVGGYMHPRHLLGHGSKTKLNPSGRYCVSPSASIYNSKFLNV